jgi:hypothetical protein
VEGLLQSFGGSIFHPRRPLGLFVKRGASYLSDKRCFPNANVWFVTKRIGWSTRYSEPILKLLATVEKL